MEEAQRHRRGPQRSRAQWHDLYEVDLNTGTRVLVEEHAGVRGYNLDFDLKPRIASKNDADGTELLRRVGDKWVSILRIGQPDSLTSGLIGIEFSARRRCCNSGGPRQGRARRGISPPARPR